MRDEEPGESFATEEREDLVVQSFAGDFVEGTERFVEEEDFRLHDERAGERCAHAHSARELTRVLVLESAESDAGDGVGCTLGALGLPDAVQFRDEFHVALDGAPLHERGVLEDVTDAVPVHVAGAARVRLEVRSDAQQGRLSATGRSDDRDEFTGTDRERDVVECAGPVGERH